MTAMFNNYPLGFYSAATLVKDAQRHGLHFLPVDINRSDYLFTVEEATSISDCGLRIADFGSQQSEGVSGGAIVPTPEIRNPQSEIRNQKVVRVGLKYVRGLREEVGEKIVAERNKNSPPYKGGVAAASADGVVLSSCENSDSTERRRENHPAEAAPLLCKEGSLQSPYSSIDDLIRRVPEINKREIRALSLAGALNFDGTVHRREALWQSELAIQPAGPLFDFGLRIADCGFPGDESQDSITETGSDITKSEIGGFLTRMEGLELVDADLRKTGISIGKHPMAFIRDEMKKLGILSAHESKYLRKGQVVSVAGAVIIRQRPMTANNVVFITLEDETGFSNFVVMPDMFEKFRAIINQSSFLIIRGIFEERGMLKAISFKPLNDLRTEVVSHNFR
jgi:error-prone DNA polymerase